MSTLRTNRVHVHLPLRLLHGLFLQHFPRSRANSLLRRPRHVGLCPGRILDFCAVGSTERQDWEETSLVDGLGRDWTEYATLWLLAKSDDCSDCSSAWRNAERVRAGVDIGGTPSDNTSNIGVLQTTVAEVVTVEAHQARAYAIMPFVWCLGSIIGSSLGGSLADPVRNYPDVFQKGTILERFPYLLPNLVCTGVVIFGMIVGILFLEETHQDKKKRRDPGLELGKWLTSLFSSRRGNEEERPLLVADVDDDDDVDETGEYGGVIKSKSPLTTATTRTDSTSLTSTTSTETLTSAHDATTAGMPVASESVVPACHPAPSSLPTARPRITTAFTPQVILNIVGYGLLA